MMTENTMGKGVPEATETGLLEFVVVKECRYWCTGLQYS